VVFVFFFMFLWLKAPFRSAKRQAPISSWQVLPSHCNIYISIPYRGMMGAREYPACSRLYASLNCAVLGTTFKRLTNETLGVNIEIEKHK
jgi:hypothetical protein